jgi:hypothetical protein
MRNKTSKPIESAYRPLRHDDKAFLAKAHARKDFTEAYEELELEYQLVNQIETDGRSFGSGTF